MKKIFLLTSILLLAVSINAQIADPKKYAELVNIENLQKHLAIIAHDDMEGRETGKEGQRKAAAYIESQFKLIGLQQPTGINGYQQMYPLHQDSLMEASFFLAEKKLDIGIDFITPLNTNETGGFTGSDIVFVGYGIDDPAYSDYTQLDVKGKLVMFFLGEPKKEGKFFMHPQQRPSKWSNPGLSEKLKVATAKGAIGALVINPASEKFNQRMIDNSKKTNLFYPEKKEYIKKINAVILSHNIARSIIGGLDSLLLQVKNGTILSSPANIAPTKISFEMKKKTTIIYASNVLGVVEGSDKKDETVFLTAHYDHLGIRDGKIYNGADDDGSGTVAVIQMAAAFAKAKADGNGPRRTLVFMTVSGEEKGLWGSEYYTDNPIYPLDKTSVDLNTDMIGRVDTERKTADTLNYIYVVGHDKISSDLPIINEGVNNRYTQLVFDYKFDDPNDPNRIYFRSDHYNFARKGVPVLFFYDGMLKSDYHKPTDDIEFINWPLFEKRAKMIFYTAWEMANRDTMLQRDKPLPTATR